MSTIPDPAFRKVCDEAKVEAEKSKGGTDTKSRVFETELRRGFERLGFQFNTYAITVAVNNSATARQNNAVNRYGESEGKHFYTCSRY